MVIVVDTVIDMPMVQPVEVTTKIDPFAETIGKFSCNSNQFHSLLLLADIYHMIMIEMVIRRFEIHLRIVSILIIPHVLRIMLDPYHLEMVRPDIIVIMRMMIIHHLPIETVIHRITMTIIRHLLDSIDHPIIVNPIRHS